MLWCGVFMVIHNNIVAMATNKLTQLPITCFVVITAICFGCYNNDNQLDKNIFNVSDSAHRAKMMHHLGVPGKSIPFQIGAKCLIFVTFNLFTDTYLFSSFKVVFYDILCNVKKKLVNIK